MLNPTKNWWAYSSTNSPAVVIRRLEYGMQKAIDYTLLARLEALPTGQNTDEIFVYADAAPFWHWPHIMERL